MPGHTLSNRYEEEIPIILKDLGELTFTTGNYVEVQWLPLLFLFIYFTEGVCMNIYGVENGKW